MNVGSLFSGIGGMDYGLHRAGFTHRFFCESDPWRREVLAHHWPGVPIYEDVRQVGTSGLGGDRGDSGVNDQAGLQGREHPDLLCGGFPCQDLSVAGQRRGLAGARSSLFYEFARIIDALRPRWVLVENVPGLLTSNGGRDFGIVLGTLADIGYGLGWRVVDSRYFGVPQRRRRVFILGARVDTDSRAAAERAGQVLAVGTRCDRHPATRGETGPDVAVASLSGLGTGGPDDNDGQAGRVGWNWQTGGDFRPMFGEQAPALQKNQTAAVGVRRLTPRECERLQALPDDWTAHGPDSRRYAALGDAVTASVAEWIGRRIIQAGAEDPATHKKGAEPSVT